MRFSSVAKIEISKREDGQVRIKHIQWTGKPWDGYWEDAIISEEQMNEILKMIPKPKVPEKCGLCEYFSVFPSFTGEEIGGCNLEDKTKLFNGETDVEKFTVEDMLDNGWYVATPDWCPLKEKKGE